MTAPEHSHEQTAVEPDDKDVAAYLSGQLTRRTAEAAETWAAFQKVSREKVEVDQALAHARVEVEALTAELEQATGERDQLREQVRRLEKSLGEDRSVAPPRDEPRPLVKEDVLVEPVAKKGSARH